MASCVARPAALAAARPPLGVSRDADVELEGRLSCWCWAGRRRMVRRGFWSVESELEPGAAGPCARPPGFGEPGLVGVQAPPRRGASARGSRRLNGSSAVSSVALAAGGVAGRTRIPEAQVAFGREAGCSSRWSSPGSSAGVGALPTFESLGGSGLSSGSARSMEGRSRVDASGFVPAPQELSRPSPLTSPWMTGSPKLGAVALVRSQAAGGLLGDAGDAASGGRSGLSREMGGLSSRVLAPMSSFGTGCTA